MGSFFRKGSQRADVVVCMGSGARYVILLELDLVKVVMPSSHGSKGCRGVGIDVCLIL